MSSRFKNSKFKHTTATVQKKELWYPDLKPAPSSDFTSITASARYIAVAWSTPGTVALLKLEDTGKRPTQNIPLISGHSGAITDLTFNPFNDSVLATTGEDGVVKVWAIPDDLNVTAPTATLSGHGKRVETLKYNPVAANVLASGSADKTVKIWDIEAGKAQFSLGEHADAVHSLDWNWNGSLLVTTSKDKKIRIFDVRANKLVQSGEGHQGVKPSRVVWVGNSDRVLSTGFSKSRDREYIIWDSNLKNLERGSLGTSTGVVDVFYDPDAQLAVLAGKGEGSLKVLEVGDSAPFFGEVAPLQTDQPQLSVTIIPKRACDLMNTEIIRVLKLTTSAIIPVSYSVPRKARSEFQEDLYPPTKGFQAALAAQQYFAGETKDPLLVKLKPTENKNAWWEAQSSSSSGSSVPLAQAIPLEEAKRQEEQKEREQQLASPHYADASTAAYRYQHKKQEEDEPKSKAKLVSELPKVQVVRSSKFRHINVKQTKKELWYDNLRLTTASNASEIKANSTYFCVTWQGSGGNVAVFPLSKPGKLPDKGVPFLETGSACLDFDFSPFDDSILALVNESAHLQIWKIPEGGLTQSSNQAEKILKGHTRRVTTVDFHPVASNVVLTASGDNTLRLWDIEQGQEKIKLDGSTDMVLSDSWNWNGSIFATSSKDKILRIYDPRAGQKQNEVLAHDGAKGFKLAWMGREDKIVSVGFNRASQRQIFIWDVRKLNSAFSSANVDNSSGLITPYYDAGTGVVFLPAKGEGNVKMYELNDNSPYIHFLTEYRSTVPAVGYALYPKINNDVKEVELARFFKLCTDHMEPLSFRVPRTRMEFFQDDIFPDIKKPEPAESGSAWFSGTTNEPALISLRPEGMPLLSEAPVEEKVQKYVFDPNQKEGFSKERFLSKFGDQMTNMSEADAQVLVQDRMQGATAEEWED